MNVPLEAASLPLIMAPAPFVLIFTFQAFFKKRGEKNLLLKMPCFKDTFKMLVDFLKLKNSDGNNTG